MLYYHLLLEQMVGSVLVEMHERVKELLLTKKGTLGLDYRTQSVSFMGLVWLI